MSSILRWLQDGLLDRTKGFHAQPHERSARPARGQPQICRCVVVNGALGPCMALACPESLEDYRSVKRRYYR